MVGGHGARLPWSQKHCRSLQTHAVVAKQQQSKRPLLEASLEEMVESTAAAGGNSRQDEAEPGDS